MTRSDVTTLPVALDTRAYDIHIGSYLIDAPAAFAGAIAGRQVLIVTN